MKLIDILNDLSLLENVKNFSNEEHEKFFKEYVRSRHFRDSYLNKEQISNLAEYVMFVPKWMFVPIWVELVKLQIENVSEDTVQECNLARFHRTVELKYPNEYTKTLEIFYGTNPSQASNMWTDEYKNIQY